MTVSATGWSTRASSTAAARRACTTAPAAVRRATALETTSAAGAPATTAAARSGSTLETATTAAAWAAAVDDAASVETGGASITHARAACASVTACRPLKAYWPAKAGARSRKVRANRLGDCSYISTFNNIVGHHEALRMVIEDDGDAGAGAACPERACFAGLILQYARLCDCIADFVRGGRGRFG